MALSLTFICAYMYVHSHGSFITKFCGLGVQRLMLPQLLLSSTVADCVCHQVPVPHICAIWRSVDGFYEPHLAWIQSWSHFCLKTHVDGENHLSILKRGHRVPKW